MDSNCLPDGNEVKVVIVDHVVNHSDAASVAVAVWPGFILQVDRQPVNVRRL